MVEGGKVSSAAENAAIAYGWPLTTAAAVAVFCVYLFIAAHSTLWDRDEPRFSQATVEMIKSGNYLYPTFNGSLRPDKPIMIYWIMSLAVRLCGENEIGFRFVAALSIALAMLGTYWIGRRVLNPRAAFWSAVVLACTPLAAFEGTMATTDAFLLLIFVVTMATLIHSFQGSFSWKHALVFGLLCSAALLTKGPVGIGIPILGTLGTCWLGRGEIEPNWKSQGLVKLAVAAVLGIAIFVAWGIPANNATVSKLYPKGEYLELGMGHHVVERASRPLEHHGGSFLLMLPFYIPVVIAGFLPWTLFLPASLTRAKRGECGGIIGRALIFGWSVPTFILMTIVATKMPHYILPIWPALALSVGATIDAAQSGTLTDIDRSRITLGGWISMLLAIGVGVAIIALPQRYPAELLKTPGLLCGAAIVGISATALVLLHRGKIVTAATFFPIAAVFVSVLVSLTILPAIEQYKLTPRMAREIETKVPHDVPVVTSRFDEPSMILYLRRGVMKDLRIAKEIEAWFAQRSPGVLIMERSRLLQFQQESKMPQDLEEIVSVKGFDFYSREFYTNGEAAELVALKRPEK
jgi:4-amino-4-deoxy-L-arabinose transferase-like glycosyltransferase